MAITGSLTYKGFTAANAYIRIMEAHSNTYDIKDTDGNNAKELHANCRIRFYMDASTKAADPNNFIEEYNYSFVPSVAADAKNILEQAYVHLKTLDAYKEMTDA